MHTHYNIAFVQTQHLHYVCTQYWLFSFLFLNQKRKKSFFILKIFQREFLRKNLFLKYYGKTQIVFLNHYISFNHAISI